MNFTHLLASGETAPQELLQRFEHYLVVTVLDDDMAKMVEEVAGFQMQSSDTTLCQIVRPLDFEIALPGSPLHHLRAVVQRNPTAPSTTDFSFVASASRTEITRDPPSGGLYVPLFLNILGSRQKQESAVSAAVSEALLRTNKLKVDEAVKTRLQSAAAAASLVASVFKMALGLK